MQYQPQTDEATGKWVLVSATTASAMAFIDGSALNVVLPSLQRDLGATATDLLWILNAYLLFLASLTLLGGTLGDRLGRKKVFMWGIGLFMLASLGCGLAPSPALLILARAVQGVGGALMVPGSLAIISSYFKKEERGQAIGTWSAVTTMVTMVGPALGGFLADLGWWRAVFFLNLPLGLLALLALYFKVPESRSSTGGKPMDWLGALLAILGLAGITYGFISMPELGFRSIAVAGTLVVGALALLLFVWVEAKSNQPMVPLQLFRNSTFSGANLLTLLLYGALNVGLFILVLNLVQVQQYSQLQAGLATLPFALLLMLCSRRVGKLAGTYGPRWFLIVGPALVAVGFVLLGQVEQAAGFANYWHTYLPGVLVFGAGMALTVAPLTTAVMGAVEDALAGTASGVNNAVSRTAGVLSIAVVGAMAVATFGQELQASMASINLGAPATQEILAQADQLGGATVPEQVQGAQRVQVQQVLDAAFLEAYTLVMHICAALALLAAVAAFFLVSPQERQL
ncbi:MFS transporter [Pontibacter akesuensis]|uniref:Drug resistance transporter, EmrB/QacA subfamily n=1 Tax=Pontibacter akesuensis TaxID=388950 RepID=A0A1I7JP65_9BACT|nr:MFS transporter [Pontibacter akesuensis]GHA68507.1 MFS transporter [Pontibacter akesuensis]SFU86984.1 drug resistance transporter, EmrB/QacA subfamily [Pontibacter akesuensis]